MLELIAILFVCVAIGAVFMSLRRMMDHRADAAEMARLLAL
ncbi:hypothetical protein [Primorskyibacter sp. S87]